MALQQFYGQVVGRSTAARVGTKESGLITRARTRNGEIHVRLWYDEDKVTDMYEVTLEYYHKRAFHKIILAKGSI